MMGIKIAVALQGKGYRVNIIEKEPGVLPLHFNDEAQNYIRDIFTEQKIHLFVGTGITSVQNKREGIRITLPKGGVIDADVLINATGVKSRVSFLEETGIKVSKGIRSTARWVREPTISMRQVMWLKHKISSLVNRR
jgi:pyruvate/2-oxoglutarate dehydrogenase complex dihydrolipoamide dehydrogenase (E3) component